MLKIEEKADKDTLLKWQLIVTFQYKLPKEEGVYVLKDDTYEDGVKQFDYLLVYFHAPWCGHCKAFGPGNCHYSTFIFRVLLLINIKLHENIHFEAFINYRNRQSRSAISWKGFQHQSCKSRRTWKSRSLEENECDWIPNTFLLSQCWWCNA